MVNGRNKGSSYEREIAHDLFDQLGMTFKRDLDQYRAADHGDLICDDPDFPFLIECKRYASGCMVRPAWVEQAQKAAKAVSKFPAVIYRYDRKTTRVSLPYSALAEAFGGQCDEAEDADITFNGFCFVAREIMAGRNETR